MALATVVLGAQGEPPQVQLPSGMALRVSALLALRSSSWFSCDASRLRNPPASCLLALLQTFVLS